MSHPKLSSADKLVFAVIIKIGEPHVTRRVIKHMTGLSARGITNSIRNLVNLKMVDLGKNSFDLLRIPVRSKTYIGSGNE